MMKPWKSLKFVSTLVTLGLLGAALTVPAHAFTPISQPDAAYTSATTLIPVLPPDFTDLGSISDGTLTVTFPTPLEVRTVPVSWASWGAPPHTEGSTPRVLFSQGQNMVSLSFDKPLSIFGFEAEPDPFELIPMTAVFKNGSTVLGTINRDVDGDAGARLFAAMNGAAFTSVDFSAESDFAIGQLRYEVAAAPVPEPATLTLLAGSLLPLGRFAARRRRRLA